LSIEHIVFQSGELDIHGTLHQVDGEDPAAVMLFCHGAFETQENWSDFAERLCADGLASFTFDFAGQGESQGTRGLVDLRIWAYNLRDALSCLQSRGFKRFGVVGWDSGGSATLLAAAHDTRLSCLVILSAPVYLAPPFAERVAYGLISTVARIKKAVLKKPLNLSRLNELQNLRMLADENENEAYFSDPKVRQRYAAVPVLESLDNIWVDITRSIRKIEIPVLIVHGAEDKILSPEQSQTLFTLLNGPEDMKLLEGSGHAVHLDRKKEDAYILIRRWARKYLSTTWVYE
jgi:alpha-beta hydrolase superfamily lysophospholipase